MEGISIENHNILVKPVMFRTSSGLIISDRRWNVGLVKQKSELVDNIAVTDIVVYRNGIGTEITYKDEIFNCISSNDVIIKLTNKSLFNKIL